MTVIDPDDVIDCIIRGLTAALWFGTWLLLAVAAAFLVRSLL